MGRTQPHPLAFGTLLRSYRQLAGLTQEMLAARAGFSQVYIGMLERGARLPLPATLELLASALGLATVERTTLANAARESGQSADADIDPARFNAFAGSDLPAALVAALRQHLANAGPPVLLLTGASGTGKTRTLNEVAKLGRAVGWTVLRGACAPVNEAPPPPFAPVAGAIASALADLEPDQQRTALWGCEWLTRMSPDLGNPEQIAMPGSADPLTREHERRLVFGAVGRLLANLAGPSGTLLVLDDLQWSGQAALDLLAVLSRDTGDSVVRIVGAYCAVAARANDALVGWLADLASAHLATSHSLDPRTTERTFHTLDSGPLSPDRVTTPGRP